MQPTIEFARRRSSGSSQRPHPRRRHESDGSAWRRAWPRTTP